MTMWIRGSGAQPPNRTKAEAFSAVGLVALGRRDTRRDQISFAGSKPGTILEMLECSPHLWKRNVAEIVEMKDGRLLQRPRTQVGEVNATSESWLLALNLLCQSCCALAISSGWAGRTTTQDGRVAHTSPLPPLLPVR